MEDDLDFAPESPQRLEKWLRLLIRTGKFAFLLLLVPVVVHVHRKPLAEQTAMREKLGQMKAQRDELLASRDKLLRQVEWIKTDSNYLEIRARDHENMHKKGEYVIRFTD